MSVTLRDLEEYWTLVDILDANAVLDALDDAEARASAPRDDGTKGRW